MFKKTLISLAVASSLGLTGCLSGGDEGANANPDYKISNPDFDGKTWPVFNPVTGDLPIPNDLIFDSEQGDGTFGVEDTSPVTAALNELSGASTVAPVVIALNGRVNPDTVKTGETVFLIELSYASGDPVQGLGNQEPPAPSDALGLPTPAYRADVETLDGNSAIRILPLEPLNPRKRYVAIVTTGIEDINGDAIIASPSYGSLTDENQPLGTATLAPVRALINGLWEPIAAAAGIPEENIALSYSFTTSNDEKVLQYIAEPGAWFSDQLKTFVSVAAAKSAQEEGASSYAEIKPVVDGAVGAFPDVPVSETETFRDVLPEVFGAPPCSGVARGQAAFDCTGVAITSQLVGLNPDIFPTPIPGVNRDADDFTFVEDVDSPYGPRTGLETSALVSRIGQTPATTVRVSEGTVNLPYYLANDATGIVTDSWQADPTLAAGINDLFSGVSEEPLFAQGDPNVSTAVNYIFPFPERTVEGGVDVPILALYPNAGTLEDLEPSREPKGVVIFQHGITTDRSAALTFGSALAADGYLVLAIDQPLHGIGAITKQEEIALRKQLLNGVDYDFTDEQFDEALSLLVGENADKEALTALFVSTLPEDEQGGFAPIIASFAAGAVTASANNPGSTLPGLAPQIGNERHFGLYAPEPNTPTEIDYEAGKGDSGSLFINLQSFLTTRDNARQSAVDQMNLRASLAGSELQIPGFVKYVREPEHAFDVPDSEPVIIDKDTPVYFVASSLGTITGAPFVASVNENQVDSLIFTQAGPIPSTINDIEAASLLTPGGGVVGFLENSPSLAPQILTGLQQAGLQQGSSDLESFLNIFQATFDSVDPINFAGQLAEQETPVLLSQVVGDQTIPNGADEMLWGIPPLKGNFPLQVSPTQTINVTIDSFSQPLAGGLPLASFFAPGCLIEYEDDGREGVTISHETPTSADPVDYFATLTTDTIEFLDAGACAQSPVQVGGNPG